MDNIIKGFTLAEVLITLVIIGVVVAMTISNILVSTQKHEYVSSLKKANSVLQQSLYRISNDNGYARGDYSYLIEDNKFYDEFAKVVNVIHTCSDKEECNRVYIGKRLGLDNSDLTSSFAHLGLKGLTTSEGMQFAISWNNMQLGLSSLDYQNIQKHGSIVISVDVNGERMPNKLGLDSFMFVLLDEKGIVPAGSGSTADCNRKNYGFSCAAKVLKEGKINY